MLPAYTSVTAPFAYPILQPNKPIHDARRPSASPNGLVALIRKLSSPTGSWYRVWSSGDDRIGLEVGSTQADITQRGGDTGGGINPRIDSHVSIGSFLANRRRRWCSHSLGWMALGLLIALAWLAVGAIKLMPHMVAPPGSCGVIGGSGGWRVNSMILAVRRHRHHDGGKQMILPLGIFVGMAFELLALAGAVKSMLFLAIKPARRNNSAAG